MRIRQFNVGDLDRVREIHSRCHEKGFGFPDFERIIAAAVVEDSEGRIAALGMIRPIAETIMILDLAEPLKTKARALELLIEEGDYVANKHGFNQTHAFVEGPHVDILKKHFGFRNCKGQALVRDV